MPEGASEEMSKASLMAYEVMRPKMNDMQADYRGGGGTQATAVYTEFGTLDALKTEFGSLDAFKASLDRTIGQNGRSGPGGAGGSGLPLGAFTR